MSNKKNCWYDEEVVPQEMLRGAKAQISGWKKLEETSHYLVLKSLIEKTDSKTILDLGCGAGEVGRVFNKLEYTGADLPHIIEKVSKVMNPQLKYISFEANDNSFKFIENFDIVLMNSLLSELENPIDILPKIFKNISKYCIIHRQDLTELDTYIQNYSSYGGKEATNSFINSEEFKNITNSYNLDIIDVVDSKSGESKSILLKKRVVVKKDKTKKKK